MSELNYLLAVTALLGIGYGGYQYLKKTKKTSHPADRVVTTTTEAQAKAKEIILNAKDEALQIKRGAEQEIQKNREGVLKSNQRLLEKEEKLDFKLETIQQKEHTIEQKANTIESRLKEIEDLKAAQLKRLENVASMSTKEAEELMLKRVEEKLSQEVGKRVKEAEEVMKEKADEVAKEILVDSMQHAATDYVAEYTTSLVNLPNEDMKGRIIGKEGRNIKAFERITGVNVDLDDSPGVIRLSCFDPVRREIAKVALEKLIKDGRIQPTRIEEIVAKTEKELDQIMTKAGEKLCHDVNVYNLPNDLTKLLGRFKYRYSYGQNMIQHTLEETKLGIKLAKELGAAADVVRLACLLHDIGKVVEDNEGTHIELGVELLKKYKLPPAVIACVAEHHEDQPFSSIESVIVYMADAISASRPGARHEDYEAYVKRMRDLEDAATSFPGVSKAYAISAGRELRVLVEPEEIDDLSSFKLARDVADKVERELVYPGQVKVTVVREVRAEETAR